MNLVDDIKKLFFSRKTNISIPFKYKVNLEPQKIYISEYKNLNLYFGLIFILMYAFLGYVFFKTKFFPTKAMWGISYSADYLRYTMRTISIVQLILFSFKYLISLKLLIDTTNKTFTIKGWYFTKKLNVLELYTNKLSLTVNTNEALNLSIACLFFENKTISVRILLPIDNSSSITVKEDIIKYMKILDLKSFTEKKNDVSLVHDLSTFSTQVNYKRNINNF